MTTVLLVRHATTDYVSLNVLSGLTPGVHLNAQGQREADDLARRLAGVPLQAIYSSPLERAVDTAHTVAACHRLPISISPDFREADVGDWTGKPIKELQDTDIWKQIQASPKGVRLGGTGETIDEVQARMVTGIDALRREHPDGVIAVFSHADPIKAALAHYLEMGLDHFQRLVVNPASVSVLHFEGEKVKLLRLNESGKLALAPAKMDKREEGGPQGQAQSGEEEGRARVETNILFDLNPVTSLTAGAVGEPGRRTFFIQGRQGATNVTVAAEKEQVAAMATGIIELLDRLGEEKDETLRVDTYEMALREPLEPIFQTGQLGLGYDQANGLIVLVAYEIPADENVTSVDAARFWATPTQMRALAKHAAQIVSAGRPVCVLCGKPVDPEGHFCPRRNGHGARATLV